MREVTTYKLSRLLTIKNGKDYKHLATGSVPVFGSGGYMCSVDQYLYDKPSILLPRKGTLTNIQYYDKPFWTVDTCFYSIVNEDIAVPYYLFWYLKMLDLSGLDSGASIPSMTIRTYNSIKVTLPPLPTQRRIASILSTYDSLIENNTRRIRLLEQMAENLYKEWFVRFRFPGHETCKMVDGIPEGWRVERIGNICETIGGGTPSTTTEKFWGGDIKWVTPTDITGKNSLPLINIEGRITEAGLKHSSAKLLPAGTILMTSRASIGFFGISREPVCTNQGFISIIPNDEKMRMYILYNLQSRKEEIIANANGSTFLEISKGRFRKMKMLLPTADLLMAFESKCEEIFDAIYTLELSSASLSRQRDLLLPRLMSGKIEV